MTYTLIHYRPNGSDYCRGCYMGGTSSDLEIVSFTDIDDAAKSIAHKLLWNEMNTDRTFADWETTILIDGYTEHDNPAWDAYRDEGPTPSVPYSALEQAAQTVFGQLKAKEAEKKRLADEARAAAAEARRVKDAEDQEKRDRAEFTRLSAKFRAA